MRSGVVTCWYGHLRLIEHVADVVSGVERLLARGATHIEVRYDEEGGCDV